MSKPYLEQIAGLCGGGHCPTVYRTDRGTYVVQGYTLDAAEAGLDLAPGEALVEIPAELFTEAHRAA
ncbi:MAG: hypothetical protein ABW022_03350 [Actinoplanes sp.]